MELYITNREVPKTYRNKRIYSGINTTSSLGGNSSIDTSNLLKLAGLLSQTVEGDLVLTGNLYASGDVVAYSSVPGIASSWWDAMPKASNTVLGGIKVGANLSIDSNGVLSAQTGGLTSVDWSIIQNKPSTFTPSTHTHAYSSLTGLPSLFDGNYNSLSNKPDLSVYQLASSAVNTGNISGQHVNSSVKLLPFGGDPDYMIYSDAWNTSMLYKHYSGHKFTDGGGVWSNFTYNNNQIYHAGNLNRSDTDFTAKDLTAYNEFGFSAGGGSTYGAPAGKWSVSAYENYGWNFTVQSASGSGQWSVGNAARTAKFLTIKESGNVGIGTTTPTYKLEVNGSVKGGDTYTTEWFRNTRTNAGLYNEANATGIWSDAYGQMRIYNGGSLRVDNIIDAYGGVNMHNSSLYSANQVYLQDNGNGSIELGTYQGVLPGYPSGNYPTLKSSTNIFMAASGAYIGGVESNGFYVEAGKQYRNYGNGFKSENYRGLVGDYDTNSTASKIIWTIGDSWNTIETHYGLGYQYYGGADFGHTYVVRSSGTVKIKLGGNDGHIWGAGSLTMGGDITAYSDARLKTDLQPITNALDKIQNIQGYYYKRTDSTDNKQHIGMLAQEVHKEFPELVNNNNDTLSLNYQNYVAVLNEAIKELKIKIDELERRIK